MVLELVNFKLGWTYRFLRCAVPVMVIISFIRKKRVSVLSFIFKWEITLRLLIKQALSHVDLGLYDHGLGLELLLPLIGPALK